MQRVVNSVVWRWRRLIERGRWIKAPYFAVSLQHAIAGLQLAWRAEHNLRVHVVAAVIVGALAAWFRVAALEWAALILTIGLVISAELLNTAIETAIDLASPEHHALAKIAKDVAAGAVLVASIAAVGVGVAIFWPRIAALLAN